ncbi:MAG TPA: hypothetical protein DCP73_12050 [Chloroflexi bacterium]|nr:hypothetical protein [Chloroflexota bacterium]
MADRRLARIAHDFYGNLRDGHDLVACRPGRVRPELRGIACAGGEQFPDPDCRRGTDRGGPPLQRDRVRAVRGDDGISPGWWMGGARIRRRGGLSIGPDWLRIERDDDGDASFAHRTITGR